MLPHHSWKPPKANTKACSHCRDLTEAGAGSCIHSATWGKGEQPWHWSPGCCTAPTASTAAAGERENPRNRFMIGGLFDLCVCQQTNPDFKFWLLFQPWVLRHEAWRCSEPILTPAHLNQWRKAEQNLSHGSERQSGNYQAACQQRTCRGWWTSSEAGQTFQSLYQPTCSFPFWVKETMINAAHLQPALGHSDTGWIPNLLWH